MKLFLCGDVMTGRGIDQVLPHPSDPAIFEPSLTSAADYVALAEQRHGAIPRPVDYAYIWGEFLSELDRQQPDARIVNLETSVTTSNNAAPKGINYRMHPANVACLTAAGVDCCNLANNHVLDWGAAGLLETLETLHKARIAVAGVGRGRDEAAQPAVLGAGDGRVLVFGFGTTSSGVPPDWEAGEGVPGVRVLPGLSRAAAGGAIKQIARHRRPGDIVVASIHWGGNWGYGIRKEQRAFAHRLLDSGVVDVIHGHSSHHVKGIEVYRGKLVLYGCGDFITDYEGISGHEPYRPDLALAYFVTLDGSGSLEALEMAPFRSRRFRLERATPEEGEWLRRLLDGEGAQFGTGAGLTADGSLSLRW